MTGFDASHLENFDFAAVGGFQADQFANFEPTAMEGFDAAHLENFDTEAVSGFARDHLTGMDVDALTGFDVNHVVNLEEEAKEGFGDHVVEFENFDLDVRGELVGEEAQLLGGVGSFDDLLALIDGAGGDGADIGWSDNIDLTTIDFGAEAIEAGVIWPEFTGTDEIDAVLSAFGGG